jgi:hypothetical protein
MVEVAQEGGAMENIAPQLELCYRNIRVPLRSGIQALSGTSSASLD